MRGTGRDGRCHGNHVASELDWRIEEGVQELQGTTE
jgi:hypothetical protein